MFQYYYSYILPMAQFRFFVPQDMYVCILHLNILIGLETINIFTGTQKQKKRKKVSWPI